MSNTANGTGAIDVHESGAGLAIMLMIVGALSITPIAIRGYWLPAIGVGAILGASALVFSSLRIRTVAGRLVVRLGGVWTVRDVPLTSISSVRRAPVSALAGIGIRLLPTGTLYNVGFGDAVEVVLRDGSRFFVGVTRPDSLCEQLEPLLSAPSRDAVAARL